LSLQSAAISDEIVGHSPYATLKRPALPIEARSSLELTYRGPYPVHGLLLAYGSFVGTGASWLIVDFDTAVVEQIMTITQTMPDGERESILSSKNEKPLSSTQLRDLVILANQVWNPPPTVMETPSVGGTDSACSLVLFNGPEILHDWGFQCKSKRLVDEIEALGK